MRAGLFPVLLAFIGASAAYGAPAPQTPAPIYVVTYVDVQAGGVSDAQAALKYYREASRQESGAQSIDVYQQKGRINGFAVMEVWRDDEAFGAHDRGKAFARLNRDMKPILLGPFDVRPNTAYTREPVDSERMGPVVSITHVDVPPPFLEDSGRLVKRYVHDSRDDGGLRRLDVLQGVAPRPNHFTVIESWASEADLSAHQMAAHTRDYREGLAPKLGSLYDERMYQRLD